MFKIIVVLTFCTILLGVVATPIYAAPRRGGLTLSASPFRDSVAATTKGRCEVPVLWRSYGTRNFPSTCGANSSEVGTLHIQPALVKGGVMQLFIEWRIVTKNKLKFQCTGPLTYWYSPDNLLDHAYTFRVKPKQNLFAAYLAVTPDGWNTLAVNSSRTCQ